MTNEARRVSPEVYLAVSAVVSIAMAFALSRIPSFAFGGFVRMAAVLIAADLVLYVVMKARRTK